MEQQALFNTAVMVGTEGRINPAGTVVKTLQCPSDVTIKSGQGALGLALGLFASYGSNGQVFGTITTTPLTTTVTSWSEVGGTIISRDIPDGTSNTIFYTEKVAYCGNPVGATEWTDTGTGHWSAFIGNKNSGVGATALSPNIVPQFNINNALSCLYYWPSSGHTGVLIAALGDGSVRFVNQGMSVPTFNIALVPNDGLSMPPDW